MAEWFYEDGIGENRAVLIEGGEIVEAEIELPTAFRAGAVLPARLTRILEPGRRGLAVVAGAGEILVEPLATTLCEGATFRAEIQREPIPEGGKPKLARGRATTEPISPGRTLAERVGNVAAAAPGRDPLEAAGWSELLEEAATGEIAFTGGALRMSLTPAMTLFDVDGALPPEELAVAGARAAGRAIRRLGVTGSIGIDLPTLERKSSRQRAAEALDAVLPAPFERTAVNGFGFLQVIRRRERPSVPEMVQGDPIGAAARALLRRAERAPGSGTLILSAATSVAARIEKESHWVETLSRRTGARIVLQPGSGISIFAGHAQRETP